MAIRWNRLFTDLLRGSRSTLWGNWALNPIIQPGAVGIVDPTTGEFTLVKDALPTVDTLTVAQSRKWNISSKDVHRRETKSTVSGTVVDPATGVQVKPDTTVEWRFENEASIASEFAIHAEQRLSDLGLIEQHYAWLHEQAKRVGMATDQGISEGFGVVTNVIYASSGINAGAKKKGATFSLSGTASGLNTLLGDQGIVGSGKASFILSHDSAAVETHTLPAKSGEVATQPIPIAYGFASFAGSRLLMPNWIAKLGSLKLHVDSKASLATTYIAKVNLSYDTPAGREERTATVLGGSSANFNDIPLSATRLKVVIEFVNLGANEVHVREWNTPLSQWVGGTRTLNLSGTWPGSPTLTVVEED
ncbi:hypothetical protein G7007_01545 [Pseudomonas entomophila]|jgi:hypothetical protein|uniref:hypothetical protein n=1 Tax=Pseudomonas entomophila TaxID=312306 RepID=UPI0015E42B44|nr:hypothetical protein [Pseudomonas entomophila]MBA1191544.1 hypothetical protein [Pseudomonas entomophila]